MVTVDFLPILQGPPLLLVSGSEDATIRVWHVDTGLCLRVLDRLHTDVIQSVRFLPHAPSLSPKVLLGAATAASHSQDNEAVGGSWVVSSSLDGEIRVWDISELTACYIDSALRLQPSSTVKLYRRALLPHTGKATMIERAMLACSAAPGQGRERQGARQPEVHSAIATGAS